MENIVEKLNQYFKITSSVQILNNWEATKDFDQVGPIMDDFLNQVNQLYKIKLHDPTEVHNLIINDYSPKFTSDFFV